MLMLTDEVDDFVMKTLVGEGEKDYMSITSENADLLDSADEEKAKTAEEENKEMLDFLKNTLSGKASEVIISKKLKSHPVCLGTTGPVTLEMEKYFAQMPGDEDMKPKAQRVLELNASHPVFEKLKALYGTDKEKAEKLAKVLYAQAILIAGLPIDNPTEYTELLCELL